MSVLRAGEAGGLVRQHENASEGHQSATSLVNSSRKQEKGERWRDREMDEMEEMEEMEGEDHHPGPWADLREEPLERGSLPSPAAARPPRPQRFVFNFPEAWEECLAPFDDLGIHAGQKPSGPLFMAFSMAITGMTTIELAFVAPLVLYVLAWDSLATQFTYLALTTALVSQIPKRFVWRSRPYLAGRAQMRRKDKTSSFPSRAVTCAVVYSFALCSAFLHLHSIQWWMPLLILVAFLLSSFARINLGVHYPSDCLGGLLQGVAICLVSVLLWEGDGLVCESCSANGCYSPARNALTWQTIGQANWYKGFNQAKWIFVCVFVAMSGIVGICLVKPFHFWTKCDRVFGLLFPCLAFRITFLCPASFNGHTSLMAPSWPPSWYFYIVGVALASGLTTLGILNKGRYPFIAYLIFFLITFFFLSWWRLFVVS